MGTLLYKAVSQAVVLTSSAGTKSLSEEIKYATLNTLVGLTVVFAILTIIIFIISLFKIIPYLQNKYSVNNSNSEAVDNAVAQITEQEEAEELINDCELVAVITAAIYASMGSEVPADGLVVRSIRRAGKKSWMNA
jgi:Na+-transporting methylmalonyl-CoA/oxaloacetate decarboxylase gamma subunit